MKDWLKNFILGNWQRKVISFILAIIIWLLVNNSLIIQKTYSNVSVRVTNVPKGVRVEGLRPDGFLKDGVTLTISGYKKVLDDLQNEDIQILLNAHDKNKDWVAIVNKHQVVFLNNLTNPYPHIRSVSHEPFVICMSADDNKKP